MMSKRLDDYALPALRLFAGVDALVSWYNSMNIRASPLFRVGQTEDGSMLLWIMALTGGLIVLDVIINDLTPSHIRFGKRQLTLSWLRAFKYRHLLFVVLATCYAAQPFVAERAGNGVQLLVFFYWNSLQNISIAFFDAKQRARSNRWQRACS